MFSSNYSTKKVYFTEDDMNLIYTYLGNDCNRKLCEDFINSGFDMNILREKEVKNNA